jgi:glutathione synthase/RimK-type ligase-like ATP-grasp enzyme
VSNRVAIVTCEGDNVDPDNPTLFSALESAGLDAQLVVWDDPAVDWGSFDQTVIRSTWNYSPRRQEFLRWAKSVPRLENPYAVLEYSSDKHYLADLKRLGIRVVEGSFFDVGTRPVFPAGDFVVKPTVGAGSWDAARYRSDEVAAALDHVQSLHDRGRDVLVQPYVSSVDNVGERAVIFIDGTFSHAMTKGPMLNVKEVDRNFLFRMEQMSVATAEPDVVAIAQGILEAKGYLDLLYARIDFVTTPEGWAVMELELVEPSLFLTFVPEAATRLARALRRRLQLDC